MKLLFYSLFDKYSLVFWEKSRIEANIKIIYIAGRATVPANVRLATLMLVQHLWTTSQNNKNGGRPNLGGDDTFVPGMGFAVPNRVKELLQPGGRVPGVA